MNNKKVSLDFYILTVMVFISALISAYYLGKIIGGDSMLYTCLNAIQNIKL